MKLVQYPVFTRIQVIVPPNPLSDPDRLTMPLVLELNLNLKLTDRPHPHPHQMARSDPSPTSPGVSLM